MSVHTHGDSISVMRVVRLRHEKGLKDLFNLLVQPRAAAKRRRNLCFSIGFAYNIKVVPAIFSWQVVLLHFAPNLF
ncbi:hypothetical protein A6A22_19510 [Arthrobacter sp. OY3WO11]|nr:hypothetical protein A6A22_19510 [Arthrobacter sp. OY3WO11]